MYPLQHLQFFCSSKNCASLDDEPRISSPCFSVKDVVCDGRLRDDDDDDDDDSAAGVLVTGFLVGENKGTKKRRKECVSLLIIRKE